MVCNLRQLYEVNIHLSHLFQIYFSTFLPACMYFKRSIGFRFKTKMLLLFQVPLMHVTTRLYHSLLLDPLNYIW